MQTYDDDLSRFAEEGATLPEAASRAMSSARVRVSGTPRMSGTARDPAAWRPGT